MLYNYEAPGYGPCTFYYSFEVSSIDLILLCCHHRRSVSPSGETKASWLESLHLKSFIFKISH